MNTTTAALKTAATIRNLFDEGRISMIQYMVGLDMVAARLGVTAQEVYATTMATR